MPVPPTSPERLHGRVFRGTDADRAGLLSKDQLRSSAWRRLRRDVYADARLGVDHLLFVRGIRLLAPPDAVYGGLTAACLWGGPEFASATDPVEVILPPGARWTPGHGVLVRTARTDGDVLVRRGCRVTSPARTGVDLIRRGPVDDAVVLLDRLVGAGVVDLQDVRDAAATLPRGRGSRAGQDRRGACRRVGRVAPGDPAAPPPAQ